MLYSSYRLVAHSIGCHTVCRLLEVGLRSFTEVTYKISQITKICSFALCHSKSWLLSGKDMI